MNLRKVTSLDAPFLYELYKERDPRHNSQYRTAEENLAFVTDHPYTSWYIVMIDGCKAGAYTITPEDETGSWLLPEYQGQGYAKAAYRELFRLEPREQYHAYIGEWNTKSQGLAKSVGFHLVSYDYESYHYVR